jgi:phosphonate transport system substrate-binding protein
VKRAMAVFGPLFSSHLNYLGKSDMNANQSEMCSIFCRAVTSLVLVTTLFSPVATAEQPQQVQNDGQYLMGVFPYLAPRELEKMYAPIAADISGTVNRDVLFMTSSTYKMFMANLDKEMYDIVFVQPFDYVTIADKYGYRPLATRNKPLPAILVVKPDSEFKTIEDLRGKTIALPPSVAAISYLIKDYLKKNGLDPASDVTIEHHRSHASCMHNVLLGTADACGTAPPALRFFKNKMNTSLNVIAKTKGIPNSIFAVHPRVPKEVQDKLMQQITSWTGTEDGKKLLKGVKVEAFVSANDKEYDVVRAMAKEFR